MLISFKKILNISSINLILGNENNNIIFEMMLQHGLDLERMEGDTTLKEQIKSFDDEGINIIIEKYSKLLIS